LDAEPFPKGSASPYLGPILRHQNGFKGSPKNHRGRDRAFPFRNSNLWQTAGPEPKAWEKTGHVEVTQMTKGPERGDPSNKRPPTRRGRSKYNQLVISGSCPVVGTPLAQRILS